MDVNISTTIILRLHPTRGSPNNVCLVANAWYNCSARSNMRSEFGVSPRERPSGKKRQVLYHFGLTRVALRQAAVSLQKYGSVGPIRGSAENNSGVIVTRPASDPYLMTDPTRDILNT